MREIRIHSVNLLYDSDNGHVSDYVHVLGREDMKDEFKAFCYQAHKNENKTMEINAEHDHRFNLTCTKDEFNCTLTFVK